MCKMQGSILPIQATRRDAKRRKYTTSENEIPVHEQRNVFFLAG